MTSSFIVSIDPYKLEFIIKYGINGWLIIYNGFTDYNQMIWFLNWIIPQIKHRVIKYRLSGTEIVK